jgi:Tfp pilus assembly protein PilV
MRTWRSLAGESGYGMVSVLVAIVLLSAGVVVLSSSSVFLTSLRNEASVRTVAASIALGYMEEIKTRDRATLASEDPAKINERGELDEGGDFLRVVDVEPDTSVVESVRVKVRVGYPGPLGRTRAVEVVTIIYVGN